MPESSPVDPTSAPLAEPVFPDEVLQIPAFRALLEGSPPAVSFPVGDPSPEVQTVTKHRDELFKAGFGAYRSLDGISGAFFNTRFVTPEELKLADQKGKLNLLAPPFNEVTGAFNSELGGDGAPSAAGTSPSPAASPAAPATQKTLAQARVKNLAVGAPTSGPAPGSGRILNNILKTTV